MQTLYEKEVSPKYLVSLLLQTGITREREYLHARRIDPEIVPSIYWVRKHFGSWGNLAFIAKRHSLHNIYQKIMDMREKLGRWPTHRELVRAGYKRLEEVDELFLRKNALSRCILERAYMKTRSLRKG